ncbi:hypothetical protein BDZ91DRAFT_518837 [Kalaharituber pfeilii]|nr:hypothetical protein BDZ91DRAFT_518837 [Kalaharituber pfeilii]
MSYCESCTDPLVFTAGDIGIVNGDGSTRGGVRVVDDIELICGHHFHWSCFSDAYTSGRKTTCPHCEANIIDGRTNKLLVTMRSDRGEQTSYDLGTKLEEQNSNHELKRMRDFLDLCSTGDNRAILSMLGEDPSLLAAQDFETAQTGLHFAIRNKCYDTAILLLARGADRNARDNDGKTFIDLARLLDAPEDVLAKLRCS